MSFAFDRPIGSPTDVAELEYVSALLQTDVVKGIRRECSIEDKDISLFLSSRYGVVQSSEQVRDRILSGLASDGDYMDIMQLVSLLLVPYLREKREERDDGNQNGGERCIFKLVLEAMLHDVTGSTRETQLTARLVKQILRAYGETALSENEDLVNSMMEQAEGGGQVMLSADTFCSALTNDLQVYNVEDRGEPTTTNFRSREHVDRTEATEQHQQDLPTTPTAPQVDNTADTFRSLPLVIAQWGFFMLSFQTYLIRVLNNELLKVDCTAEMDPRSTLRENVLAFGCTIGLNAVKWALIMLSMVVAGLIYFWIGGVGNKVDCKSPVYPFVGLVVTSASTVAPILVVDHNKEDVRQMFLVAITCCFGGCAVALNVWHLVAMMIPRKSRLFRLCRRILVPAAVCTNFSIRKASAFKVNKMVENAKELHSDRRQENVTPNHYGQAFQNFMELTPATKKVGGLGWTCRSIWSKELFRREGLVFSGRLVSTSIVQFVICMFILIGGIVITLNVGNSFEAHMDNVDTFFESLIATDIDQALSAQVSNFLSSILFSICPDDTGVAPSCNDVDDVSSCIPPNSTALCTLLNYTKSEESVNSTIQMALLNASGMNATHVVDSAADNLVAVAEYAVDRYYPTDKYMVVAPLATGVGIAVVTAFVISAIVLPSAASTTLKLRSGVIPFATDPRANKLRLNPDQTMNLRGLMYWGCIFASILMGSLVAILVFLFLWQVTSAVALRIAASVAGSLLILLIQQIINRLLRQYTVATAFYREKPGPANIGVLVRECGLIALTQGFVAVRTLLLSLTTVLYVGRLDTPFLYEGIGEIGCLKIDGAPYLFMIDILQHEAHRHPFIELFGDICLSKLEHRDDFLIRGGSAWRLIFVHVLMPWLSKYRVMTKVAKAGENQNEPRETPLSRSLETLAHPRAYQIRVMSMIPVASDFVEGSIRSSQSNRDAFRGYGRDNELQNRIKKLEKENETLRMQVHLLTC